MAVDLEVVPEAQRDTVAGALTEAFGSSADELRVVTGGASGALTYRVEAPDGSFLLRVETIQGPLRNPHQYDCMQAAAEVGVAPPIRFVDADAGVLVMPFIEQRPLSDHPGGSAGAAEEVAGMLARLHATEPFPARGDHLGNLGFLIDNLTRSGRIAPGLLDPHREGLEQIRAAYPWDPGSFVSAHNDPNQFNLLYDGDRIWLIDWETASRNDPYIDLATLCSHLAPTDELRDLVLRRWSGREPDALDRARLTLMGWVVRLFAGSILLTIVADPEVPTHTDLDALSGIEFGAAIERGELVAGTPKATLAFAKMVLGEFHDAIGTAPFDDALRTAAGG